jgi:lysophospholipase L1-like esterase
MKNNSLLPLVILLILGVASRGASAQEKKTKGPERFEKEIAAYEAQDRENPPPNGQILFTGASTIRRWTTLAQDFPEHKVMNRGFGGSQIADATHFAERIIFPYQPRAIFIRSGGNDLNAGKSVEQVFDDYKAFVEKVHGKLPNTTIYFISASPSIARWKQHEQEKELNDLVKKYRAEKPNLKYVETYDMVLGADGQPRADLFVEDKLHFNAEGNQLLAERVRPHLPN